MQKKICRRDFARRTAIVGLGIGMGLLTVGLPQQLIGYLGDSLRLIRSSGPR